MRYQERGLVQNKEHKHSSHVTKSSTKSSKARMALIFILKKFYLMLGPHQSLFILHELISRIPLFRNYKKIHSCLLKLRGAEDCLKTRVELKLFEKKLDF